MSQPVYTIRSFEELTLDELYDIMVLRQEVFVVEQDCPYLDADGKDARAFHLMGRVDGKLALYARVMPAGVSYPDHVAIGRVIVAKNHRRKGLGTDVLQQCIELSQSHYGFHPIKLSAQVYALSLYESVGFQAIGETYLEDDIPHQAMVLEFDQNTSK